MLKCKYCEANNVTQMEELTTFTYKDKELEYSVKYLECSNCNQEYIPKDLILENDSSAREARKIADGLLTSSEVQSARNTLGLTQEQASLVFGGGKNAFSKYECNNVTQSAAMDKLIRICLNHRPVFEELCKTVKVNIENKKADILRARHSVKKTSQRGGVRINFDNQTEQPFYFLEQETTIPDYLNLETQEVTNDFTPANFSKGKLLKHIEICE